MHVVVFIAPLEPQAEVAAWVANMQKTSATQVPPGLLRKRNTPICLTYEYAKEKVLLCLPGREWKWKKEERQKRKSTRCRADKL